MYNILGIHNNYNPHNTNEMLSVGNRITCEQLDRFSSNILVRMRFLRKEKMEKLPENLGKPDFFPKGFRI